MASVIGMRFDSRVLDVIVDACIAAVLGRGNNKPGGSNATRNIQGQQDA
jgi:hypothetical protein